VAVPTDSIRTGDARPVDAVAEQPGSTDEPIAGEAAAHSARRHGRLAWMDALRGIAALLVVYTHWGPVGVPEIYRVSSRWLVAGNAGVLLFFLISGFIVPASLERKGSVRTFWVSRIFRLYPLWITALIAVAALDAIRGNYLGPYYANHWKLVLAAEATMLQELIRVPSVINVMWTLSFEMVFYFLIVALFTLRQQHRSAEISVGLVLCSLIGGFGVIPYSLLQNTFGAKAVTAAVAVPFVVGLALSMSGRRPLVITGAVLLAVTGTVLLLVNQEGGVWWGFLLPATMFAGTALFRHGSGETGRVRPAVAVLVLAVGGTTSLLLHRVPDLPLRSQLAANRTYLISFALAGGLFALGYALRRHPFPRVLTWLGLVSYSTYLLHPIVEGALLPYLHRASPLAVRVAVLIGWLAVLIVTAALTYRFVELPFQRWGKLLAKSLDRRFGSDASASRISGRPAGQPDESVR
jgi:peptidoglycan/LPS O-acetylase OafA/YrhL